MVELYSMTRYLRNDLLEKSGLENFDDWASNFGEVVSQLEIKPAGDGFRMKNRFSKFANIPELMQMYKEFADIQMPDTLKIPNVPTMQTGKPIIVTSKPDDMQKAYMKELAERSERIHSGNVDPHIDNMLKITHEARLLGLDSRCINPDYVPNPDSKVNKLIDNLERIRKDTDKEKGVQIVFCDIAINEDAEHFSVYNAIKEELVKRGIPEDEICFAGDATTDKARAEMFEKLRNGEKRIIIASTQKLGTGANVQDRVAAIHHLDIPWRPSDLEQQNGRGLRQGNMFSEVGVYHYVTENTFDAYMLGIISNKAKFISQVMTSKEPARVCEAFDEMVLTYSEMQAIASGNPLIKEKIQLDNDVTRLRLLESEYKKNQYDMQELVERKLPEKIQKTSELLEKAKKDLQRYNENKPSEFEIKLDGTVYDERTKAGEVIEKALIKCRITGDSKSLGEYAGFELSVEQNESYSNLLTTPCTATLKGELQYNVEVSLDNNVGNIRRIENLASSQISQRIEQLENSLKTEMQNLDAAKSALNQPFEHAEELANTIKRLNEVNHQLGNDKAEDDMPVADNEEISDNISNGGVNAEKAREDLLKINKPEISQKNINIDNNNNLQPPRKTPRR